MGNAKQYLPEGGFTQYLYTTIGARETINGLVCEIVADKADKNGHHGGLPAFSNTADIYVGLGPENKPKQLRYYKDRNSYMDFDWGHRHENTDGTVFPRGIVHVQRYPGAHKGNARYMTDAEIAKFGDIIKHYCPEAILRP